MKKILYILLVLTILYFSFATSIIHSKRVGSSYQIEKLDFFLVNLEDEYHSIKSTDVKVRQGAIEISINFLSNTSQRFDPNVLSDVKSFFLTTDIQKQMADKNHGVDEYIRIEFVDTIGTESHYIEFQTPVEKNYEWPKPTYYVVKEELD